MKNENGFSLIEILAVLIILGILATILVPKAMDIRDNAKNKMIDTAIFKLNTLEKMAWLGNENNNDIVFSTIDYDLGTNYIWSSRTATGGILRFKDKDYTLIRIPSNNNTWGAWSK